MQLKRERFSKTPVKQFILAALIKSMIIKIYNRMLSPATLVLKENTITGLFVGVLQNHLEQLFHKIPVASCF